MHSYAANIIWIDIVTHGIESNRKIARVDKSGFASLPENMQKMVIKAIYPSVTNEEKVLFALLKRGAVSEKNATLLPKEPALVRLIDAEHVVKTAASRYYLTCDGVLIAKGALSLYPEL